jgi:hypothetical protein
LTVPHMRGAIPHPLFSKNMPLPFSPRAWGYA